MSTTSRLATMEQLWKMPHDGNRYELVDGELRKMSPAGSEHGIVIMRLASRLSRFVEQKDWGFVFGAETGFVLSRDPDTVRAPDIAFVEKDRVPAEGIPQAFWPGAPDLAVEVVSPTDTMNEVDTKVEAWLNGGTKLVWVVNPNWRTVTVYRSATEIETLTEKDHLEGGEVVPGFSCLVSEIFVRL